MPHAIPIQIPERQFLQICAASVWLSPPDRDAFWSAVVAALDDHEIGPGSVARAISFAFSAYYKPIEIDEPPQQLRKLTYGSNKLEAKYDAHRSSPRAPAEAVDRDELLGVCADRAKPRAGCRSASSTMAGYETYCPWLSAKRSIVPLFPGYCFVLIADRGWWTARWSIAVRAIVGAHIGEPARVPDSHHCGSTCSRAQRPDPAAAEAWPSPRRPGPHHTGADG